MLKKLYTKLNLKNMKMITVYISLLSVIIAVLSIERYTATTKILLAPYNFLHLHEFMQITILTAASIILSFLIFKDISNNFEHHKTKKGILITIIYFIGIYFYATGNGIHEVTNFFLNAYCPLPGSPINLCAGLFFNDYYFANILYFLGLLATNLMIIILEIQKPMKKLTNQENYIITTNAVIYALGLSAYAAFDKVIVGMFFIFIASLIMNILLFTSGKPMKALPFTSYCAIAYTLATIAGLTLKYH